MSCNCTPYSSGATGSCQTLDMICQPPTPVVTVVAGPQGATGPQGASGLIGPRGFTGFPGPQGATGPQGPIGLMGQTGPQGPQGVAGSSSPLAFFEGAIWAPTFPYSSELNSYFNARRTLDLGTVPFSNGQYLIHLEMQIGWNGNPAGQNQRNGFAWIGQVQADPNQAIKTFYWTRIKNGGAGFSYGEVESYSHWFVGTLSQSSNLFVETSDDGPFLLGAQVAVFNPASYTIAANGFI